MTEPLFLSAEQVARFHHQAIEESGGEPNIRDWGLLESAVAMPRQGFGGEFLHPTLASMAAAYFYHIVANHAFVDGNKRTGMVTALIFLKINGHRVNAEPKEIEDLSVLVAGGVANGKQFATEFFTAHVVRAAI
jgi:death on curing protein